MLDATITEAAAKVGIVGAKGMEGVSNTGTVATVGKGATAGIEFMGTGSKKRGDVIPAIGGGGKRSRPANTKRYRDATIVSTERLPAMTTVAAGRDSIPLAAPANFASLIFRNDFIKVFNYYSAGVSEKIRIRARMH